MIIANKTKKLELSLQYIDLWSCGDELEGHINGSIWDCKRVRL